MRCAIEVDGMLQQVVAAVLACDLHGDGVLAGFDGLAVVVLAVPPDGVGTGAAGG